MAWPSAVASASACSLALTAQREREPLLASVHANELDAGQAAHGNGVVSDELDISTVIDLLAEAKHRPGWVRDIEYHQGGFSRYQGQERPVRRERHGGGIRASQRLGDRDRCGANGIEQTNVRWIAGIGEQVPGEGIRHRAPLRDPPGEDDSLTLA